MNSKKFLTDIFKMAEEFEGEAEREIFKKYKEHTIPELWEEYEDWIKHPDREDQHVHLRILLEIIPWRMEVLSWDQFRYFVDTISEEFELMQKEIKRLNKFQDHRHKTIMGLYTEKPSY